MPPIGLMAFIFERSVNACVKTTALLLSQLPLERACGPELSPPTRNCAMSAFASLTFFSLKPLLRSFSRRFNRSSRHFTITPFCLRPNLISERSLEYSRSAAFTFFVLLALAAKRLSLCAGASKKYRMPAITVTNSSKPSRFFVPIYQMYSENGAAVQHAVENPACGRADSIHTRRHPVIRYVYIDKR